MCRCATEFKYAFGNSANWQIPTTIHYSLLCILYYLLQRGESGRPLQAGAWGGAGGHWPPLRVERSRRCLRVAGGHWPPLLAGARGKRRANSPRYRWVRAAGEMAGRLPALQMGACRERPADCRRYGGGRIEAGIFLSTKRKSISFPMSISIHIPIPNTIPISIPIPKPISTHARRERERGEKALFFLGFRTRV